MLTLARCEERARPRAVAGLLDTQQRDLRAARGWRAYAWGLLGSLPTALACSGSLRHVARREAGTLRSLMASLLHAPRGAHTRSSRGATLAPAPSAARTDASRQWVSPATTWLGGAAAAPSRYLHVVLGNHARRAVQAGAAGVTRDAEVPTAPPISFKKVLLCIFDSSPYLSDGSKTALLTAVQMAQQWGGKVSVLVS